MFLLGAILLLLMRASSSETGCSTNIFLESDKIRPQYAKWINVSTTLSCPIASFEWSIWYSARAVYKMSTGCQLNGDKSLVLDWFPDVPSITGLFRSFQTNSEISCEFTLSKGILKAELPKIIQRMDADYTFQTVIYFKPEESMPINFLICKKANFTNGTCLVHDTSGRSSSDNAALTNDDIYYKVTGSVVSSKVIQYDCFATIKEIVHLFTVVSKADTNECEEARIRGLQLCHSSACIDLAPGYNCSGGDYADNQTCSSTPDWFCPHTATYDYMSTDDCNVKKCIEAANIGVQLCDVGVHDCESSNDTYRCRQGVPLLDVCNSMDRSIGISCPRLTRDSPNLENFGSSLYRLAYNAKTLYKLDPEYLRNLSSKISDRQMFNEMENQSEMERHGIAQQLINTFISTFQDAPQDSTSTLSDTGSPEKVESPVVSSSVTKKIETATSLLHLIASIARKTSYTRKVIESGSADREGFKFMRLNKAKVTVSFNNSDGGSSGVMIVSDADVSHLDSIVAVIPGPEKKISTSKDDESDKTAQPMIEDTEVGSDVILVDTLDPYLTYQWTSHMLTERNKSYVCQQLRPSRINGQRTWSPEDCETVVKGRQLYCRCTPKQTGTFAIALVYWLGDPNIEIRNKLLVETVSYVFTAITVVALLLFLIFTRFIGVFRLDQFNIAFSLLLTSIAALISPLLSDKQPIACTIVAIAVCFFLLAAFCWKFIFGLNTLILIVAPHSRYHDLISKHKNCIPLVWIGYLIPAVIVAAWFGYAGAVTSNLGCFGPSVARWVLVGFITIVVVFNFIVLIVVGVILLRSYMLTRKSRINKSTHFLVLTQLMLTLGLPYTIIYMQFVDHQAMLFTVPIALGITAVLMFLLVAVIDEENRHRLQSFIRAHFTRSTSLPANQNTTNGNQTPRKASSVTTESKHNRRRLGSKQWSYREKIYGTGANGKLGMKLKQNDQVQSETRNSEYAFEPGWLHRYPATTKLTGEKAAVLNVNSHNAESTDQASQPIAPRASGEITLSESREETSFHPDAINSRGPLTFTSKNGVVNGRSTTNL